MRSFRRPIAQPQVNMPRITKKAVPTQEYLLSVLDYDPDTGHLHWKRKQTDMGRDARFNTLYAGKRAGCVSFIKATNYKYEKIALLGFGYPASRIIWIMIHGSVPDDKILDHANGNSLDNRLHNLQLVTHQQNNHNRRKKKKSVTGYKGVHKAPHGKFRASLVVDGKLHRINYISSPIDAALAFDRMAMEYQGAYAVLNFPFKNSTDYGW